MNKRHWNTVYLDQSIPKGEVERMIDNSYALVVEGLKKYERDKLILQYGRKIWDYNPVGYSRAIS